MLCRADVGKRHGLLPRSAALSRTSHAPVLLAQLLREVAALFQQEIAALLLLSGSIIFSGLQSCKRQRLALCRHWPFVRLRDGLVLHVAPMKVRRIRDRLHLSGRLVAHETLMPALQGIRFAAARELLLTRFEVHCHALVEGRLAACSSWLVLRVLFHEIHDVVEVLGVDCVRSVAVLLLRVADGRFHCAVLVRLDGRIDHCNVRCSGVLHRRVDETFELLSGSALRRFA